MKNTIVLILLCSTLVGFSAQISQYPNTNTMYPNWMILMADPGKTNYSLSGSNFPNALTNLGFTGGGGSGNGFPLTKDGNANSFSITNGLVVSATEFDSGGGSGIVGAGISFTNPTTGAWFQLTTNGHFRFFDENGSDMVLGTNYLDLTQFGVGIHQTNGALTVDGQLTANGVTFLPAAQFGLKLVFNDVNGKAGGLGIGANLSSDGINLNAGALNNSIVSAFTVSTNATPTNIYTVPLSNNYSLKIVGDFNASSSTNAQATTWRASGLFYNSAGTVTKIGTNTIAQIPTTGWAATNWDWRYTVSGTNILIQGVGDATAAVSWMWSGQLETYTNGPGAGVPPGGPFYPTNMPGAPTALAWWNADLSPYSLSPSYWGDMTANAYGMTNASVSFHPVKHANVIGINSGITFNANYWTNLQLTLNQPFTICATMWASNANTGVWFAGTNSQATRVGAEVNFGNIGLQAGGSVSTFGPAITNKFATYTFSFNGATTTVWTNGVQAGQHSVGTSPMIGIGHGADALGGTTSQMTLYDMVVLNGVGSTAIASNYNYSITNSGSLNVPLIQP